jgi:small ligand-binding sensory domain FIST
VVDIIVTRAKLNAAYTMSSRLIFLLFLLSLVSIFQVSVAFSSVPSISSLSRTRTRSFQVPSLQAAFRCSVSQQEDYSLALDELLSKWEKPTGDEQSLAFLFVTPKHADSFGVIVKEAAQKLGPQTKLLALVGGGIVGGNKEVVDSSRPSMSLLAGILPQGSHADLFCVYAHEQDVASVIPNRMPSSLASSNRPPSYFVFPDPYSTKLNQVLQALDNLGAVVAGGVSVPLNMRHASLAIQDKVLPTGSIIGVCLGGNIGLQTIVAQGCRRVGPTFTVTNIQGNAIHELDSESAIEQLEQAVSAAPKEDQELVRNFGVLGGVHRHDAKHDENDVQDYLIRQVLGFRPQSGSILVGGNVKEGDSFRFHVRSADSAREDMQLMIQRAKTERLFMGTRSLGEPLCALQISSIARGQELFGSPNIDLQNVQRLFEETLSLDEDDRQDDGDEEDKPESPPVAGFFANGEIGPVGIRMGGKHDLFTKTNTHLLGFTTVVAMLCDYSAIIQEDELYTLLDDDISAFKDAWG